MREVEVRIPRKYSLSIVPSVTAPDGQFCKWAEFSFRSKRMPNGYTVTLAAIYLKEQRRTIFGASACAPDDVFDGKRATEFSLGRARSQAFRVLAGELPEESLIGSVGRESLLHSNTDQDLIEEDIRSCAGTLYIDVAFNAEVRAIFDEYKLWQRMHPKIDLLYIIGSERKMMPIRQQSASR